MRPFHRISHFMTAYHWRDSRKRTGTVLGHCRCGWKAKFLRKSQRARLEELWCGLRGHDFGPPINVHAGPIGFEESEDTVLGSFRQCERCHKCT